MRGQALALGLLLAVPPIHQARPANAIDQQIDTLFSSLSNRTDPGIAMTTRRGVLAGGSLSVRNRIYEANPVSVTPPSFKAGCGGIDLYGGSFSFINGEQFITPGRRKQSPALGSHRTWRAVLPHHALQRIDSQHCERLELRIGKHKPWQQ